MENVWKAVSDDWRRDLITDAKAESGVSVKTETIYQVLTHLTYLNVPDMVAGGVPKKTAQRIMALVPHLRIPRVGESRMRYFWLHEFKEQIHYKWLVIKARIINEFHTDKQAIQQYNQKHKKDLPLLPIKVAVSMARRRLKELSITPSSVYAHYGMKA